MGHEVRLQIFPDDSDVARDWLSGKSDGNAIQHCFHVFGFMRRGMQPWPFIERDSPELQIEAQRFIGIAQQYPWILNGFCDLDRRYDHLIYMLELMADDKQQEEMARVAVLGTRQVAGSAIAGQGFPINWSSATEAKVIEGYLNQIDQRELANRYLLTAFPAKRNIYKGPDVGQDFETAELSNFLNTLFLDLSKLLNIYKAARQTKFAVIVVRD